MRFAKMHGAGNDFIVASAFEKNIPDPAALARLACRRRFGVGADGLILLLPSARADASMRIFNSDGSEPEMCGNGIRCAAKFLYDENICRKTEMEIDTLAGVKLVQLEPGGRAARASVDMGAPEFAPERIPVDAPGNRVQMQIDGRELHFFCVSMGNPHAVTFDLYPGDADFLRLGALIERHPFFPARTNVEFCRVESRSAVSVKVWERGAGATLACGTGSCAVLAAGASLGLIGREAEIRLPGGALVDRWTPEGRIIMCGPAETVFYGELEI